MMHAIVHIASCWLWSFLVNIHMCQVWQSSYSWSARGYCCRHFWHVLDCPLMSGHGCRASILAYPECAMLTTKNNKNDIQPD